MYTVFFIIEITKRDEELINDLVCVWEQSVKASHHFLASEDIAEYRPFVIDGLKSVEVLSCVQVDDRIIGFAGVNKGHLEMLFLHPDYFGDGIGEVYMRKLIEDYQISSLDVNEQNERAKSFYEKFGFKTVSRKDVDDFGKPYPILTMKLVK